ncbi:MAG: hypothetical protein M1827_007685 [Pycnora praestabilis]|nr:MAG: hypothetical protein M1827_007685 [Pycnora praestabilis]
MQTSLRPREVGGGYQNKAGHVPQISISDDNHHITEAIGDMYGDHDYGKRDSRPLSFIGSPLNDTIEQLPNAQSDSSRSRAPVLRTLSNERVSPTMNGQGRMTPGRNGSFGTEDGSLSPSLSLSNRSPSDTANSQFPLNDIDYESDPAAVAQELSNLQALRRMSMDQNAAGDPDLPGFNTPFAMPTIPPSASNDEDDASRLFWVPARLHPELAPKEFKTFIEGRVDQIKRRSGENSLSPDGPQRQGSGGGLRRKKSMLSRQIDNAGGKGAEGYTDGAERLDRKRSLSNQQTPDPTVSNLQELEVLVNDPKKLMQKLSLDTEVERSDIGPGVTSSKDMPILPAPPGQSLRRSTRTTYRRGSLRKGERVPFSKRAAKAAETDTEESPVSSPIGPSETVSLGLSRVQTDPSQRAIDPPENFSRPQRSLRGRSTASNPSIISSLENSVPVDIVPRLPTPPESTERASAPSEVPEQWSSRFGFNGRSTASPRIPREVVPQIIETPPPSEDALEDSAVSKQGNLPERISSHEPPPIPSQSPFSHGPPTMRQPKKSALIRQAQNPRPAAQTLHDMASHPSPLPGNSTRTDSLSFIPTIADDKKVEKKGKDKKEKDAGDGGTRKSSWGWLLGNEEKEKEKKDDKESQRKGKMTKIPKPADKSNDNTRLDLLQTSIDGGRGRESVVLDRESLKLDEERKKESTRKSTGGDSKKEKESGIFSSLFGGGKKKGDRDSTGKKGTSLRALSPDPPHRILKPDVDYNWTRFSILEERAIYRMAHIKLANPRRALYSQVLLSNFMYSYLAKVQQMHPQMQIPQSAAQKQQQQQQRQTQQRQPQQQPEEYYQYQQYQKAQEAQSQSEGVNYVDDSQIYDYDHQDQDDRNRPQSRTSQHHNGELVNGFVGSGSSSISSNSNHHSRARNQGTKHQHQQPYHPAQYDDAKESRDNDMW